MPNTQLAGFQPHVRGGCTPRLTRVRVLTNNTTAIFKGDAVEKDGTGGFVAAATANDLIATVQWGGASYMSGQERLERKHLPAATTYSSSTNDPANASYIFVVADPVEQQFLASVDEAIVSTDLGLNYQMVLGAGNTTTGFSGHELDATGRATTATLPWRVEDLLRGDPRSNVDQADAMVICSVNGSQMQPGGTTTGT